MVRRADLHLGLCLQTCPVPAGPSPPSCCHTKLLSAGMGCPQGHPLPNTRVHGQGPSCRHGHGYLGTPSRRHAAPWAHRTLALGGEKPLQNHTSSEPWEEKGHDCLVGHTVPGPEHPLPSMRCPGCPASLPPRQLAETSIPFPATGLLPSFSQVEDACGAGEAPRYPQSGLTHPIPFPSPTHIFILSLPPSPPHPNPSHPRSHPHPHPHPILLPILIATPSFSSPSPPSSYPPPHPHPNSIIPIPSPSQLAG